MALSDRQRVSQSIKAVLLSAGTVGLARNLPPGGSALPILVYHSVSKPRPYRPPGIAVQPELFDRQLAYLVDRYCVLTLDEVVEHIAMGKRFPRKAVTLTFDDGYLDNYELAFPILRKHGLTATFFVSTGPVLQGDSFWVGWLHSAIACTRRLAVLVASLGIDLDVDSEPDGKARDKTFLAVASRLTHCGARDRRALCSEMQKLLGDVPLLRCPSEFMMRAEHLRELARAGMTIGSHTVSHPILSEIDESEASFELIRSRNDLEDVINKPVGHIAYPNGPGVPRNFNDTVQRLAREAGYRSASTSIRGVARVDSDLYALPRQGIDDALGFSGFAFKLEEHRFSWLLRHAAATPFTSIESSVLAS